MSCCRKGIRGDILISLVTVDFGKVVEMLSVCCREAMSESFRIEA